MDNRTIRMFGLKMLACTMDETIAEINRRLNSNNFTQHGVVNVAKLVRIQADTGLKRSLEACDLMNIDGIGVVWGGRFLGFDIAERVTGIDLFYKLLELAEKQGEPVFLLGAKEEVLQQTVEKLRNEYPELNIAGWHHGYFWNDEQSVVDIIQASGATMLFVGIETPLKEQFINRWQKHLGTKFAMGVGGAFDIVAGITKRAPVWMRKNGLEWFYRLIQEPKRMWKRYLISNSKFVWMLMKEKARRITLDQKRFL